MHDEHVLEVEHSAAQDVDGTGQSPRLFWQLLKHVTAGGETLESRVGGREASG